MHIATFRDPSNSDLFMICINLYIFLRTGLTDFTTKTNLRATSKFYEREWLHRASSVRSTHK
jgi:hypothetical protein